MNRIILIGNGFDLAHGLPTSFVDFLDDYWNNTILDIKKSDPWKEFENNDIRIDKVPSGWEMGNNYESLKHAIKNARSKLDFKNNLLKQISEHSSINKWVDIENEYYSLLVKSFKSEKVEYSITDLNNDLITIKEALKDYITKIENEADIRTSKCLPQITSKIFSKLNYKEFTEKAVENKAKIELEKAIEINEIIQSDPTEISNLTDEEKNLRKFSTNQDLGLIRNLLIGGSAGNYFDLFPDNFLFLNFNYTKTDKFYHNPNTQYFNNLRANIWPESIYIHGTVYKHDSNPIIFGFGDEIDQNYKTIENLNDNRYLEHIKSIKYLETDNYKRMLEFINSDEYQIFIFGHSCGNSDRTLLNTLFEHKNCVSIKPFYHQIDESRDNYNEIVMNITRNFNDKASLRNKVVNKKYCEPLCINA